MAEPGSWCTIESDPGVFTELISTFGVKGVQVEEIYSLDPENFQQLKPVYGLIFLFKWRQETDTRSTVDNSSVFFANQVIPNACATQAILSILLNCPELDLGEELTKFKAFTNDFPPDLKGLTLTNSHVIRNAHNSFARPQPFIVERDDGTGEKEDVFHFISYVPVNGVLYELDGLKDGPISLGECTSDDWLEKVQPHIESRMKRYASSEIRFNLMAIVKNKRLALQEELERLNELKKGSETQDENAMEVDLEDIDKRITDLEARIKQEETKLETWRVENIRRKHNYIPFLVALLRILAQKGELMPLLEQAKRKL